MWVTPPSPHGTPNVITPFIGFSAPLMSGKGPCGHPDSAPPTTQTQRPPPPVLPLEMLHLLSVRLFLIHVG